MATILLQAGGAYLGGLLGSVGGAIGSAAGAVAGYVLDRALLESTQHLEGPRLTGARPFTAEEGVALPRLYGTARLGGTLIWATRFEESRKTRRQGKFGPKITEYSYYANAAFALCEGEVAGIRRIWADGREIDRENVEFRLYGGSEDQLVDPLIAAKQGEGNAPAYRGVAYVVIDRFDIGDYGNRIPQLQFEVIRPVGALNRRVRAVSLIPGATEYGLSAELVTRRKRPGETEAVNRHVLFAGTDIAASLDELQATCPNLENVALVVAWFGDDLRAGHCRIRPAVTTANGEGLSSAWTVSGTARDAAPVVSSHAGAAAYGGTPTDTSVMSAIAEIRSRGLGVTLYPYIMMDIADGNVLSDPYGNPSQPAYPWRGRITCDPAPLLPDSADRTALARTQVAAFCGSALRSDFEADAGTIVFTGAAGDWGYRRFILHHAHLAALAGGVDAFLIGAELRGLTTLRDEDNAFPFVEALCDLAGDVRLVLGSGSRLTYGADWSEYFGHHPADGGGDVYFHLDALWSHAAIDAVGIDNYMPLSDWRDADYGGGNPDGFAGPYDPAGLSAMIAGGEGFDWYYPTFEARAARDRVLISDGAAGKAWVFRYKDIVNWWSNRHYNRIGGVEQAEPTAWVAGGKPVWFTELGCPAADKGPNQPNAFPDPKSAEDALPYFSDGGRSDIAPHRFLDAHLRRWNPSEPDFDDASNPLSGVYGGRMIDPSRLYLWAWDARPFPAFPQLGDLWSDGANWDRGHWLNGRLASPDMGSLVNAILADHGQDPASVEGVEGTTHGYVITDPTSARAALEPLADLFNIVVREDGDTLVFAQAGSGASAAIEVTELVSDENGPLVQTVREPDHQLPAEAVLTFSDPFAEYQSASVRSVRLGAAGSRQQNISFAGVMERGQGGALLDDWLKRLWYERETVTFSVVQPNVDIGVGAVVNVPDTGDSSDFLVTDIDDGQARKITAKQISRSMPTPWRGSVRTGSGAMIASGPPQALFLDLPAAAGAGDAQDQFRAAVWQKPWRSQALFVSPEDTGFALRALIGKAADLGRLTQPLTPGFEGRIDRAGSMLVELFEAEISSVSLPQLLNGANAAAVRSATNGWEVFQFETAEEISPQLWRLSGLLRGQLGTGDAMAAGADAGADFVMLDDAVQPAGLLASETGLLLNWRAGPSASDLSSAEFATSAEIGGVRALLPFSPVHLKAEWSTGDLILSWIRRSRLDGDNWDAAEIPLGEDHEEYQLQIAPAGGAIVRTETMSEPAWTYTAAAIAADFGAPPAEFDVTVRQLSVAAGWGIPAMRRLTLS